MNSITKLFQKIAIELTMLGSLNDFPIWSAQTDTASWHSSTHFTSDDGKKIWLRLDTHEFTPKSRIEISGGWPTSQYNRYQFIHHSDNPPKITVSANRAPQAIAKDIQNRFIPRFYEVWPLALDGIKKHDKQVEARREKINAILDAWPSAHTVSHSDKVYIGDRKTPYSGQIEVYYHDNMSLHLSGLTVAQIKAIANILEPTE